jgi:adenosylcobyric acid synthase
MIEPRLKKPCMGVVPHIENLSLDEEDSVGFAQRDEAPWSEHADPTRKLRIGVIALPSISNFTDFDSLQAEPCVALRHLHDPANMALADIIILPGSKQTADDLHWLRERGFESVLNEYSRKGGLIVGICGGFQMLGKEILDPHEMERAGTVQALGLLPITTILKHDKITVPARGTLNSNSLFGQPIDPCELRGYEIHLGTTQDLDSAQPFASIVRQTDATQSLSDGCVSRDGRIFGTYLHGLFDHDTFRHAFLRAACTSLHLHPPTELVAWSEQRSQQLDQLADAFADALDLDAIFAMLDLPRYAKQVERRSS